MFAAGTANMQRAASLEAALCMR